MPLSASSVSDNEVLSPDCHFYSIFEAGTPSITHLLKVKNLSFASSGNSALESLECDEGALSVSLFLPSSLPLFPNKSMKNLKRT